MRRRCGCASSCPAERAVARDGGAREVERASAREVALARHVVRGGAQRAETRRRISAAALRVNVMATTCSGCCTVASSAR